MSAPDLHLENSPAANGLGSPTCYGHELDDASTRAGNPAGVRPIGQRLTHLDLFTGIGGFALAARWAGIDTIGFSEIEPYACRVLAKNFPNIPNHGDIRKLSGVRADIITGGFPCQPFSLAGERLGADDDRHLWPEMLRVIAGSGATWVVGENVPGIIGLELDNVLSDLEALGYAAWPVTVPACAVDAKHRRERVWIVAHNPQHGWGARRPGGSDSSGEGEREQSLQTVADSSSEGLEERTKQSTREECQAAQRGGDAIPDPDREQARRIAVSWRERSEWQPEPAVGRVANGIPARVDRLRGLGNAIVPQVAFVILDAIAAIEFAESVAGVGALADLGGPSPLRKTKARNAFDVATEPAPDGSRKHQ